MALSHLEKERIIDSQRKIQSIALSLHHVDPEKVPGFEEIQDCLEDTDKNLSAALRKAEHERG
jgi:hypothetical protein